MTSSTEDPIRPRVPVRILCVDDSHDVADSEVLLLQLMGFEAKASYDGASALKLAESFRPTVCLVDLNMPGMNGDELAVRLREQMGSAPLVLIGVTARSDEESGQRLRDAGFHLHLVKPVDPTSLIASIRALAGVLQPKA